MSLSGTADAAPLLHLLGQDEVASRVSGQLTWTGSAQGAHDDWHISLASNLAGVESRLPEPFDKSRTRTLPVSAQMRVGANGIQEFLVDGRDLSIRGVVENGITTARFDVQGVNGELRRAENADEPRLKFERLELKRAPAVLAVAGALLPAVANCR